MNAHQKWWAFGFPVRCSSAIRHAKALESNNLGVPTTASVVRVDSIAAAHILVEREEVGERDGEGVDLHVVIPMLLDVRNELITRPKHV